MSEKILVLAPHPDDETLGCGGTLLRLAESGAQLAWVIVTSISEEDGFAAKRVHSRDAEIDKVADLYKFTKVFRLSHPTRQLDLVPMSELIEQLSEVFRAFLPTQVFLPNQSDVHSDHRVVFDAGAACTKWFRNPSVRRVLAYETISETDFSLDMRLHFPAQLLCGHRQTTRAKTGDNVCLSVGNGSISLSSQPRSHPCIGRLSRFNCGLSCCRGLRLVARAILDCESRCFENESRC